MKKNPKHPKSHFCADYSTLDLSPKAEFLNKRHLFSCFRINLIGESTYCQQRHEHQFVDKLATIKAPQVPVKSSVSGNLGARRAKDFNNRK